jgi:hypothetical protein
MHLASLSLLSIVMLSGCKQSSTSGANEPGMLMANDFEASVGWNDVQDASLTTEKAHSGHWSILAKPDVPFSYTYVRRLDKLDPKLGRNYELRGWAQRAGAGSNGRLVVHVQKSATDTAKVFYSSIDIGKKVKAFNQWKAISMPILLPASAQGGNMVKIYLWNDQSSAPTFVDDLELAVVK